MKASPGTVAGTDLNVTNIETTEHRTATQFKPSTRTVQVLDLAWFRQFRQLFLRVSRRQLTVGLHL